MTISNERGFPFRLFAWAFVCSIAAALIGTALSWHMHQRVANMVDTHVTLTRNASRILLLDEALTMSARMAAATGSPEYRQRYDQLDPELTAVINEVRSSLPQSHIAAFINETDAANTALVAMERQAMAAAAEGRQQDAVHLLESAAYLKLKDTYAEGMRRTVAAVDDVIASDNRTANYVLLLSIAASLISVLAFTAAWLFAVRSANSWVTERGRAEEALRESQALTAAIIENVPLMISLQEPRDLKVVLVNRAGEELLGYDRAHLLGRRDLTASRADQLADRVNQDRDVLEGKLQILDIPEERVATPHKGERVLHTRKVCIRGEGGESKYLLGISDDITERKQFESERAQLDMRLRETQKLEALGTLAGGVAHDFNNALAVILGNAELVRQDVGPDHAALESIEEIRKAGRRARNLVQQILTFGRRQTSEREVTSLAPVVHEAARFLRATIPAVVGVHVECAPDTPDVLIDASQIEQVLINLGTNAWHAVEGLDRPGEIEVALRGSVTGGARVAVVEVRDNGRGMDESTRARIFEPFFTTKAHGTGLGLSVVHGIVAQHGASIDVTSMLGSGTSFVIQFPAARTADVPDRAGTHTPALEPAAAQALQEPRQPARDTAKHILYLDDEAAIVLLMKRLLERRGFRVSGYTDPEEALSAMRADPAGFDLVVTDYNMPGMSGLEVAHALKAIAADLPIVMASGYITDELRAKAPAAGVRELVYKSQSVDTLCSAVVRYAQAKGEA